MRTFLLSLLLGAVACAQTPSYPGAVVLDSQLSVAKNRLQTTLASGMATTDSAFTVASATGIAVNMLLSIDSEIVWVCGVSGTNIQVGRASCPNVDGRGFDSTTAAVHVSGALVSAYLDAWHHNAVAAEVKSIESALGANLANVKSANLITSTSYDFTPQSPGGALTGAILNLITLTPCPSGVAGTNTGYTLYLSGGVGTAEAMPVSGGTCTSGAVTGTVIGTPAFSHSGAWTVSSATTGIGEAICALPSVGGEVSITGTTAVLRSDASACGKAAVQVHRYAGTTITGSFLILGNTPYNLPLVNETITNARTTDTVIQPVVFSGPANLLNTNYYTEVIARAGNADPTAEWRTACPPTLDGLGNPTCGGRTVGLTAAAEAGAGSKAIEVIGIFASANNASPTTNAVAASLWARPMASGADNTHRMTLWAINSVVADTNPYTPATVYSNTNLTGAEMDFAAHDPTTKVYGISIGGSSTVQPALAIGFLVNTLGNNLYRWDAGFETLDGTATVGLQLGASGTGNGVNSQTIVLYGRDGGGVPRAIQIYGSSTGGLILQPAVGAVTFLPAGVDAGSWGPTGIALPLTADIVDSKIKSTTGQRFVCVTTAGLLVSSATACVGT